MIAADDHVRSAITSVPEKASRIEQDVPVAKVMRDLSSLLSPGRASLAPATEPESRLNSSSAQHDANCADTASSVSAPASSKRTFAKKQLIAWARDKYRSTTNASTSSLMQDLRVDDLAVRGAITSPSPIPNATVPLRSVSPAPTREQGMTEQAPMRSSSPMRESGATTMYSSSPAPMKERGAKERGGDGGASSMSCSNDSMGLHQSSSSSTLRSSSPTPSHFGSASPPRRATSPVPVQVPLRASFSGALSPRPMSPAPGASPISAGEPSPRNNAHLFHRGKHGASSPKGDNSFHSSTPAGRGFNHSRIVPFDASPRDDLDSLSSPGDGGSAGWSSREAGAHGAPTTSDSSPDQPSPNGKRMMFGMELSDAEPERTRVVVQSSEEPVVKSRQPSGRPGQTLANLPMRQWDRDDMHGDVHFIAGGSEDPKDSKDALWEHDTACEDDTSMQLDQHQASTRSRSDFPPWSKMPRGAAAQEASDLPLERIPVLLQPELQVYKPTARQDSGPPGISPSKILVQESSVQQRINKARLRMHSPGLPTEGQGSRASESGSSQEDVSRLLEDTTSKLQSPSPPSSPIESDSLQLGPGMGMGLQALHREPHKLRERLRALSNAGRPQPTTQATPVTAMHSSTRLTSPSALSPLSPLLNRTPSEAGSNPRSEPAHAESRPASPAPPRATSPALLHVPTGMPLPVPVGTFFPVPAGTPLPVQAATPSPVLAATPLHVAAAAPAAAPSPRPTSASRCRAITPTLSPLFVSAKSDGVNGPNLAGIGEGGRSASPAYRYASPASRLPKSPLELQEPMGVTRTAPGQVSPQVLPRTRLPSPSSSGPQSHSPAHPPTLSISSPIHLPAAVQFRVCPHPTPASYAAPQPMVPERDVLSPRTPASTVASGFDDGLSISLPMAPVAMYEEQQRRSLEFGRKLELNTWDEDDRQRHTRKKMRASPRMADPIASSAPPPAAVPAPAPATATDFAPRPHFNPSTLQPPRDSFTLVGAPGLHSGDSHMSFIPPPDGDFSSHLQPSSPAISDRTMLRLHSKFPGGVTSGGFTAMRPGSGSFGGNYSTPFPGPVYESFNLGGSVSSARVRRRPIGANGEPQPLSSAISVDSYGSAAESALNSVEMEAPLKPVRLPHAVLQARSQAGGGSATSEIASAPSSRQGPAQQRHTYTTPSHAQDLHHQADGPSGSSRLAPSTPSSRRNSQYVRSVPDSRRPSMDGSNSALNSGVSTGMLSNEAIMSVAAAAVAAAAAAAAAMPAMGLHSEQSLMSGGGGAMNSAVFAAAMEAASQQVRSARPQAMAQGRVQQLAPEKHAAGTAPAFRRAASNTGSQTNYTTFPSDASPRVHHQPRPAAAAPSTVPSTGSAPSRHNRSTDSTAGQNTNMQSKPHMDNRTRSMARPDDRSHSMGGPDGDPHSMAWHEKHLLGQEEPAPALAAAITSVPGGLGRDDRAPKRDNRLPSLPARDDCTPAPPAGSMRGDAGRRSQVEVRPYGPTDPVAMAKQQIMQQEMEIQMYAAAVSPDRRRPAASTHAPPAGLSTAPPTKGRWRIGQEPLPAAEISSAPTDTAAADDPPSARVQPPPLFPAGDSWHQPYELPSQPPPNQVPSNPNIPPAVSDALAKLAMPHHPSPIKTPVPNPNVFSPTGENHVLSPTTDSPLRSHPQSNIPILHAPPKHATRVPSRIQTPHKTPTHTHAYAAATVLSPTGSAISTPRPISRLAMLLRQHNNTYSGFTPGRRRSTRMSSSHESISFSKPSHTSPGRQRLAEPLRMSTGSTPTLSTDPLPQHLRNSSHASSALGMTQALSMALMSQSGGLPRGAHANPSLNTGSSINSNPDIASLWAAQRHRPIGAVVPNSKVVSGMTVMQVMPNEPPRSTSPAVSAHSSTKVTFKAASRRQHRLSAAHVHGRHERGCSQQ